ncbi:hypothetical protein SAMN05421824_1353 [Hyunsoonleella jejuensis]|uniref:Uncharacterized protein n=1 Tax=Hyunsoonleella jejuensis TaxID=419940 RepID=A0A1H9DVG9_9FLAO|nr:hypothetical protein [Hyunsoonleella jejuensis]SEQ17479.1 hypothetical protein SAMN05421824_1353 [Hyunsoonleella jejuensis]
MKIKFLMPLVVLFLGYSCSINDNNSSDNQEPTEIQIYQWHLTNVSGGVAGIDIDFETDTVIWVFSLDAVGSGSLQVQNNNIDNSLEDGLETGVYSVSIPVYDSQSILFINGDEFAGLITPTEEDLTLNQNITSSGAVVSDGFIYKFARKVIIETTN